MKSTLLVFKIIIFSLISIHVIAQGSQEQIYSIHESNIHFKQGITNQVDNKNAVCDYIETFTPNLFIPDYDSIGVTDIQSVSNAPGNTLGVDAKLLRVCLSISHTWVGDITATLKAPNGQTITLIDRPGIPSNSFGCGGDSIQACFIIGTGNDVEDECDTLSPSINGIFTAQDGYNLDDINVAGGSPNGDWELFVSDGQAADSGVFVMWQLVFLDGPVIASWIPPNEVCQSGPAINLSTLVTGTPGGTFTGTGVTGNNFDPTGLSGPIDITYIVLDSAGTCSDSSTQPISVTNLIPTAAFTSLQFGTTVEFSNLSTTSPGSSLLWDFGDTNNSVDNNPIHTYTIAGNYIVTLTVSNACGSDITTQTLNVVVCSDGIIDGGFELGPIGGAWTEYSKNYVTPICNLQACGNALGTGPSQGSYWAFFGGSPVAFERLHFRSLLYSLMEMLL